MQNEPLGPWQRLVDEAVRKLRVAGTDVQQVEVKAAAGGLPKSVTESVCAFANTPGGGLVLLGLEDRTFTPVTIEAAKLASDLAAACAEQLDPPIRADIDVVEVDGHPIVMAAVGELPAERKPCHVRSKGMERGAYVRTHDGDRLLTTYEIHVLLASRGQPADDAAAVVGAGVADLDERLVAPFVRRLRETRGPVFADKTDDEILRLMRVVVDTPQGACITLAGLLTLGRFPQQFLPQLDVTFVVFPTVTGEPLGDGSRFIDNQSIDGPIPVMVQGVLTAMRRNMKRRSIVVGLGREDRWEYPEEAVREAVANALMHRDHHPMAQGAQVSVALYPDRLEVRSPGGLHGPVSRDDLLSEPVSSSRNSLLAKLLEDVEVPGTGRTVCENRGSGLIAMAAALRRAGMEPPTLEDRIREFRVVIGNHGLLDDEALEWLASFGSARLNDRQRMALAFLHRHGSISNQQYRTLTGCDATTATKDLAALNAAGLLAKRGDGRWTVWSLAVGQERQATLPIPADQTARLSKGARALLDLLQGGPRSSTELAQATGVTKQGVLRVLRSLEAAGWVEPTATNRTSTMNRWRLTPSAKPGPHAGRS